MDNERLAEENNYLAIARRAMRSVKRMYGADSSNEFCANAQKVAERYLKAVIEEYPDGATDPSILRSRSLRALYRALSHLNYLGIDKIKINLLNGYYFEASYPGDNFVFATEEDEEICLDAMEHIAEKVEKFLEETSRQTQTQETEAETEAEAGKQDMGVTNHFN